MLRKPCLTKEDIFEVTGVSHLETLIELEILFNSCDEIANLEQCCALQHLIMLDNGLKRISNLSCVGHTLTKLCLCDQDITVMENLKLPNLRELYLHRNCITRISGLNGCARLRKLWLFQNKITAIEDLHAVPELEELWLQANHITSLSGIECCANLINLGLAGNPISSFFEMQKLFGLLKLRELSFNDIHFGRSSIADDNGYKEFVLCYMRHICVLDGVALTKENFEEAMSVYMRQVKLHPELVVS